MSQNRVYYACQAVEFNTHFLEGVQSVGINASYNFEQVFELGLLEIYENVEGIPEVEVTIEKAVLSGVKPLGESLSVSTQTNPATNIVKMSQATPEIVLHTFPESATTVFGSTPAGTNSLVITSGFLTSYSITGNMDGPSTESLSFTSNNYDWGTSAAMTTLGASSSAAQVVQKRQNANPYNYDGLQSWTMSCDFGREDIMELGKKQPVTKVATFPLEVTCEEEFLNKNETDTNGPDFPGTTECEDVTTATEKKHGFAPCNDSSADITVSGGGFRLTSVNHTGGDAGGGNQTVTKSFQTFNSFAINSTYTRHYNQLNSTQVSSTTYTGGNAITSE
jgi:hypothetical protein